MLDMRSALTEEVACKHDMISALKRDVQQLEERCVQADKQTAFKDDIIKELRKEIKQLKQQVGN
jgi:predicted  nucleic acid-binding Zn-ribbon protein